MHAPSMSRAPLPGDDALAPDALAAVLESETLLCCILAAGALSARDLAAAAQVARLWRRVVGTDRLWRAAWRAEAPSLRPREAATAIAASGAGGDAGAGGAGFRAALEQLHAAVARAPGRAPPAQRRTWRLDDFVFAVDVSWHGAPLFASTRSAARLDEDCCPETGVFLRFGNTLPRNADAGDAPAELCARMLKQPHTAAAAAAELRARVLVRRSDGALACLLAGAACVGLDTSAHTGNTYVDLRTHEHGRACAPASLVDLSLMFTLEDRWSLGEQSEDEHLVGQPGPFFTDARAYMWRCNGARQEFWIWEDELRSMLRALVRSQLRWVAAPAAPGSGDSKTACAVRGSARVSGRGTPLPAAVSSSDCQDLRAVAAQRAAGVTLAGRRGRCAACRTAHSAEDSVCFGLSYGAFLL